MKKDKGQPPPSFVEPTGAQDNVDFYEAFARYYERIYSCVDATETVRQWLILMEQKGFVPGRQDRKKHPPSLLDVGCGPGWHLAAWANQGFAVSGLDSSPTMLKIAENNFAAAFPGKLCSLYLADIRKSEQLVGSIHPFDVAVSHFNFLSLFSPNELKAIFHGVYRVVRRGGIWVTDYSSPRHPLPLVRETYDCGSNYGLLRKESRRDSTKELYEQHWIAKDIDISENYWFHFSETYESIAHSEGWLLIETAEWHPENRQSPWSPLTSTSERATVIFRSA